MHHTFTTQYSDLNMTQVWVDAKAAAEAHVAQHQHQGPWMLTLTSTHTVLHSGGTWSWEHHFVLQAAA